ncbi:hypothetical protein BC827DRAFT_1384800 [Russula dissimulans]|nr:hypothetical protein BC827DRAFT_1384800 [Russula dissimulans]
MASKALSDQVAAKWQYSFDRLNRDAPGISGLMELSTAWEIAADALHPRELGASPKHCNTHEVKSTFDGLVRCRMLPTLLESFIEDMRRSQYLITNDVMKCMVEYNSERVSRGLNSGYAIQTSGDPDMIGRLVLQLADWYFVWTPCGDPSRLGHTISSAYILNFQMHLFSALPATFAGGFKKLLAATLVLFTEGPTPDMPSSVWDSKLWPSFELLGLADRYEGLIASVCYEHIEAHVLETCAGKWDEPMLNRLREWMADKVVPWMFLPYARGAKTAEEARTMLQGVGSRFDFHVCKTLCDLRTKEMFDIVIDHPDSIPALHDLKLVEALRKANKRRLLHPGADTRDILTQYVSLIRCLRIIDPPGVLLFKVADPIRRYLRDRPDTIRCIVASLVVDGESGDSLVDDDEPIHRCRAPKLMTTQIQIGSPSPSTLV